MSRHDAWRSGEIGDDGSHPGSPNYREPAYDESDARCDIAAQLVEADEVASLVADVHGAAGALDWIAHNANMPNDLLRPFRQLDRRVRSLCKSVDELVDRRNAA